MPSTTKNQLAVKRLLHIAGLAVAFSVIALSIISTNRQNHQPINWIVIGWTFCVFMLSVGVLNLLYYFFGQLPENCEEDVESEEQ